MKIGIDLGSTYSTISRYNSASGQVEALTLGEGEPPSIPSVVSLSKKGQFNCGKAAKDQIGKKTVRIFEAFKMLLNEPSQPMLAKRGYDRENTPREITRRFLSSLLRGVRQGYGDGEEGFEDVVICVPAIWTSRVRTLDGRGILRELLREEELGVPIRREGVRVVTEPEAASAYFAYSYEKAAGKPFNGHLLLIDYGGGTLDITLTKVTSSGNGVMEIQWEADGGEGENHPDSEGNSSIGSAGIAFMQCVVELALRDKGLLAEDQRMDYTAPAAVAAVKDLESQLKSAERIRNIEETFGSYGSYRKMEKILKEPAPREFYSLEYEEDDDVPVTYQHLFTAYRMTVEKVLDDEIAKINPKVKKYIGADPCDPRAGRRDDFKIALVGGFGSFYLVKKQIADIYALDDEQVDLRTKNIAADKREQAISLGAALLAEGKVHLHITAKYSIGLCTSDSSGMKLYYGILFHQTVEPGKAYFICYNGGDSESCGDRISYAGLKGIREFAFGFDERRNHGYTMELKKEMLERLEALPSKNVWNCGFSMDQSEIITFHVVPSSDLGLPAQGEEIRIPLASYEELFDLSIPKEVTI